MSRLTHILAASALVVLFAACGGPPANNPLLQEARTSYDEARNNSEVVSNASAELQEAERFLLRGERMHRDKEKPDEVNHIAYMARQRVRIAEQIAAQRVAERALAEAERERREVQLEARTIEADRAAAAARESEGRATEASQRAQELEERVRELEAEQTERGLLLTLGDVLFEVGRADLQPGAWGIIDNVARFLSQYENRTVLIEGFTDNTGSASTNQVLSERRADAVRQALAQRGISDRRIRIRGYGQEYPVAPNNTGEGRQRNRRVEIIISDEQGVISERRR